MIQRAIIPLLGIILILICLGSCDEPAAPTDNSAMPQQKFMVASLSPAATDMIVGMGLSDRLVGVSNYEPPRPTTDALPRVGDYRTVDWEKLSQLRPAMVITQYRPDKMPDGFAQRCGELGIRIFNRKIDSLDDAYATIGELGEAFNARKNAADAQQQWNDKMNALAARVGGKPRPKALLIVGETGLSAVGPGTFLDDLLKAAGGKNVLAHGNDYVTLDRERLASLDPEAIIQLLPAASPQQIEQANSFWTSMPQLRAVRDGRVLQITDADVLLPGFNCPRTAERFAEVLHRATATSAPARGEN